MPQTTFETALRYLFPGFVLFAYFEYSGISKALDLPARILISTVVGVVLYSFYRAVIYDFVLAPILDRWSRSVGRDNYRIWLMNRYGISRSEAELFYAATKSSLKNFDTANIGHRSALIHCMFQVCILGFAFFVASRLGVGPAVTSSITYLAFLTLLFVAAFAADLRIDRQMCLQLRLQTDEVDRLAGLLRMRPRRAHRQRRANQ